MQQISELSPLRILKHEPTFTCHIKLCCGEKVDSCHFSSHDHVNFWVTAVTQTSLLWTVSTFMTGSIQNSCSMLKKIKHDLQLIYISPRNRVLPFTIKIMYLRMNKDKIPKWPQDNVAVIDIINKFFNLCREFLVFALGVRLYSQVLV